MPRHHKKVMYAVAYKHTALEDYILCKSYHRKAETALRKIKGKQGYVVVPVMPQHLYVAVPGSFLAQATVADWRKIVTNTDKQIEIKEKELVTI